MTAKESDKLFDTITLFNELKQNIILSDFLKQKALSRLFVPLATFDEPAKEIEDEFVAAIEGVAFPFFGLAYSIDKV